MKLYAVFYPGQVEWYHNIEGLWEFILVIVKRQRG